MVPPGLTNAVRAPPVIVKACKSARLDRRFGSRFGSQVGAGKGPGPGLCVVACAAIFFWQQSRGRSKVVSLIDLVSVRGRNVGRTQPEVSVWGSGLSHCINPARQWRDPTMGQGWDRLFVGAVDVGTSRPGRL